ncbi:MAG: prolipoprotein diacylglyceryl transferase [Alphaproteobacteria bacterium]|nr:prolipoprotein diacylglyceryl transferase [Alphaproteobacteria bacterium]
MVRRKAAIKGQFVHPINFADLGLSPVLFEIGPFALRWYSISYIVGIIFGWWYFTKLTKQPGAPCSSKHVDDYVTWLTLGVILGGRIGYVMFYDFGTFAADPLKVLRLWEGGMSFHGGFLGVMVATAWFCRANGITLVRFLDFLAVSFPPALGFVRLANFVNGELWGKPTDGSWGIIFPAADALPRHPSQLYEAVLEGPVLWAILLTLFWKTDARYRPGLLAGVFGLGYGSFRFIVEFYREPDSQLVAFAEATGLHMGQWLSLPLIIAGLWLILSSGSRRAKAGL